MTRTDQPARSLVKSAAGNSGAAVSPEGRFLAYESSETGRSEIYVSPYPDVTSGRWQVSPAGGSSAAWGPGGRELFYLDPFQALVSVDIDTARGAVKASAPVKLFDASFAKATNSQATISFAPNPDGQRFLMSREASPDPRHSASRSRRRAQLARRVEAARAHALNQLAKTDESLRRRCENGSGASGEIDGPVEQLKPINWLIRNVRTGANKWASTESPEGSGDSLRP